MAKTLVIIGQEPRLAAVAQQAAQSSGAELAGSDAAVDVIVVGKLGEAASDADALQQAVRRSLNAVVLLSEEPDASALPALRTRLGLPRERLLSPGTSLASRRFRDAIASRLRVHRDEVHAEIVGSPGVQMLPLWSSASVAGVPLSRWAVMGHGRLDVRERVALFLAASSATADDAGSTHDQVLREILESILTDANRVFSVGSWIEGLHGIDGAWLSLPCIVNAGGAEPPLDVPMNDAELAGLRQVADLSRGVAQAEPT